MSVIFSGEEKYLIALLEEVLNGKELKEEDNKEFVDIDNWNVISLAKKHAVLPLLYEVLQNKPQMVQYKKYIEKESQQTVLQVYRLLFLTKYLVEQFVMEQIPVIVLKGVATGSFYPMPELRKSGDIDLLIPKEIDSDRVVSLMNKAGFAISEEQHANHHVVFVSEDGINIEIHTMLAEPFAYKKVNLAMEKQGKECWNYLEWQSVMGTDLPILGKPYHAYELLLHMLQHFMYAGFGLKLLCDWVYIWRQSWSEQEIQIWEKLVSDSGLERFAEVLTSVCVRYLGLEKECFTGWSAEENMASEMLREILDSEEFGNADANRMVMMSGTGFFAYVKEFQHQMHLNFPKAGKCFLLWPVLWCMTLFKFICNNRKIRNTSVKKVLNAARKRSKLMEELKLFK